MDDWIYHEQLEQGLRVRVMPDDDVYDEHTNPRCCEGNLGQAMVVHSRSNCATGGEDEHHRSMPELEVACLCEGERDDCNDCAGYGLKAADSPEDWARVEHGARVILPLYVYEHGGMTIRTSTFSCEWDSGQVGIIFCTPASLRERGMLKSTDEEIAAALVQEVEVWAWYLEGRVYRWTIESLDDDGEPDGEVDESVGGYLAETSEECLADALSEARAIANYANGATAVSA